MKTVERYELLQKIEGYNFYQMPTDQLRELIDLANTGFLEVIENAKATAISGSGSLQERTAIIQGLGHMAALSAQVLFLFSRMSESETELNAIGEARKNIEKQIERLA